MIYEIAGKNEQLTNIFKEGFVHINEALATKLFQDAKVLRIRNGIRNPKRRMFQAQM